MNEASQLLLWGIAAHLAADWLFQNNWMARNKTRITHPAAWIHGLIHFLVIWWVFPFWPAVAIACLHILIDLRFPLTWWRNFYGQTQDGSFAIHVAIWGDQVSHVLVIALFAFLTGTV